MIVEFLGQFTKTVRLNWKLWFVSIAIAIIRWEVFLDLDFFKMKIKLRVQKLMSILIYQPSNSILTCLFLCFCFPPFSWPLAVLGKLIPVPSTPFSEYFSRCSFWRKKQGTSFIPNWMQILGSFEVWSRQLMTFVL